MLCQLCIKLIYTYEKSDQTEGITVYIRSLVGSWEVVLLMSLKTKWRSISLSHKTYELHPILYAMFLYHKNSKYMCVLKNWYQ